MPEIRDLAVADITRGDNDRRTFAGLEDLAASMAAHGLAQPITVRAWEPYSWLGDGPPTIGICSPAARAQFQIVAGERRFRAATQVLGWETIPAIVRDLTDEQASAIMLAENTGQEDLNPVDEARAYQSRMDRFGWSIAETAKTAGVSESVVERRLLLLQLRPDAQYLVATGQLPLGHAEALAPLDANRQIIAIRILRESKNGLPLRVFQPIVGQLLNEQSQEQLFDLESFWVEQVQADNLTLPTRGKRAVTGAPTRADLPTVRATNQYDDTTGAVMDRYIADLLSAGFESEAAAVGNLYNTLVAGNYTCVPREPALFRKGETP